MPPKELDNILYELNTLHGLPGAARLLRQHIDALEERIHHLEKRLAEVAHLGTGAGVSALG